MKKATFKAASLVMNVPPQKEGLRKERGVRAHNQGPRAKSMEMDDGKREVEGVILGVRFSLPFSPLDISYSSHAMNKMIKSIFPPQGE